MKGLCRRVRSADHLHPGSYQVNDGDPSTIGRDVRIRDDTQLVIRRSSKEAGTLASLPSVIEDGLNGDSVLAQSLIVR